MLRVVATATHLPLQHHHLRLPLPRQPLQLLLLLVQQLLQLRQLLLQLWNAPRGRRLQAVLQLQHLLLQAGCVGLRCMLRLCGTQQRCLCFGQLHTQGFPFCFQLQLQRRVGLLRSRVLLCQLPHLRKQCQIMGRVRQWSWAGMLAVQRLRRHSGGDISLIQQLRQFAQQLSAAACHMLAIVQE